MNNSNKPMSSLKRNAKVAYTVLLAIVVFFVLVNLIFFFGHDIIGIKIDHQKIAAFLCVPFGLVISAINYLRLRTNPITRTVSTYILIAISFTGLYYLGYRHNPNYYSFASGILTETERVKMQLLTDEIRLGYRKLGFLSILRSWVESRPEAEMNSLLIGREKEAWVLPHNIRVTHEYITSLATVPPYDQLRLIFQDESGDVDLDDYDLDSDSQALRDIVLNDKTRADYLKSLSQLETNENHHIDTASQQLRSLNPSRSFSILDFLYFSVVTVTTVGYGDIVPNSTVIRMLVCSQILFGFLLILTASMDHEKRSAS